MFPMLSGLFIKGDNGWVVLAHKTISVPLSLSNTESPLSLRAASHNKVNYSLHR